MERTTGELANAYFAHLCFDQAINEVRIPCLADMREEKKDMTLLIAFLLSHVILQTELPCIPSSY